MHSEERWKQRFENFQSSLVDFKDALDKEDFSTLERAGLIQLFEVSFELAWKTLKDLLSYEGYDVNSPKSTLKQAFANNIIQDGETWIAALDGRNLFSHTYDSDLADQAIELIRDSYAPLLLDLEQVLQARI